MRFDARALLLLLTAATQWGCDGCPATSDPVRTDPQTDCLSLRVSKFESDAAQCAIPVLEGTNNCTDSLTFLPGSPVIAHGSDLSFAVFDNDPNVLVVDRGDHAREYVIPTKLGDDEVKIVVPIRYE